MLPFAESIKNGQPLVNIATYKDRSGFEEWKSIVIDQDITCFLMDLKFNDDAWLDNLSQFHGSF